MGRKERRQQRHDKEQSAPVSAHHHAKRDNLFTRIYRDHYKPLMILPIIVLLLAFAQIGWQMHTTGDFLNKGVSLKGGLTIMIPAEGATIAAQQLQDELLAVYPEHDIIVRDISELGTLKGYTIEVEANADDKEAIKALENGIIDVVERQLPGTKESYSVEVVGPSLGGSFFQQTINAVIIAFILMAAVVFLYFAESTKAKIAAVALSLLASYILFKTHNLYAILAVLVIGGLLTWLYLKYSIPSTAIIICAFADIIETVAVVNLLGIKVSTAGIAAFLMLIGYSVDTDILLSVRVLKTKKGSVYDRVISSLKTGLTMTFTAMAASLVGYFVSQSATIKEIMLIIFIGCIMDIFNTWIQNVILIRWYAEKRGL